jgi:disulfide bond formation protein DsbB
MRATLPGRRPHLLPALLLAAGMAVVILSALGFQHIGGYIPCALCLLQRWPYYIGIPVALLAALSSYLDMPPALTRGLLGLAGVILVVSAGMGVYHAGVEWRFWEGPASCSSAAAVIATDTGGLLDDLKNQHGPSCTDATLRVLGLSFAGWNVVVSLVLAAIAVRGVSRA